MLYTNLSKSPFDEYLHFVKVYSILHKLYTLSKLHYYVTLIIFYNKIIKPELFFHSCRLSLGLIYRVKQKKTGSAAFWPSLVFLLFQTTWILVLNYFADFRGVLRASRICVYRFFSEIENFCKYKSCQL